MGVSLRPFHTRRKNGCVKRCLPVAHVPKCVPRDASSVESLRRVERSVPHVLKSVLHHMRSVTFTCISDSTVT